MDSAIADTLNRLDAEKLARRCDEVDDAIRVGLLLPGGLKPWYYSPMARTFLGDRLDDQKYLIESIALTTSGLRFDGEPADGDWDNLLTHIRAEIQARRDRDPQTPPTKAAETCLSGVV